jgi:hypothetical protein
MWEMYLARYQLPDTKRWQSWASFDTFWEALDSMQFHAQGRPFEIIRYDVIYEAKLHLDKAIALMEKSKGAFKSKLIAIAREEAEKAKEKLEV